MTLMAFTRTIWGEQSVVYINPAHVVAIQPAGDQLLGGSAIHISSWQYAILVDTPPGEVADLVVRTAAEAL